MSRIRKTNNYQRRRGAFYGDPAIKQLAIDRAVDHAAADRLVQGSYFSLQESENGYEIHGCALGCLATPVNKVKVNSGQRSGYLNRLARAIGLHEGLNRGSGLAYTGVARQFNLDQATCGLIDDVFESSSPRAAQRFLKDVIEAIPVGADLQALDADAVQNVIDWEDRGARGRRVFKQKLRALPLAA